MISSLEVEIRTMSSFLTLRNSCKIVRRSKTNKEESIISECVKVTSNATKIEAIGKIDVARRSLTMNGR